MVKQQTVAWDGMARASGDVYRFWWLKPGLGVAGIATFLVLWEGVSRSGLVDSRFLPPISDVLATMVALLGTKAFWTVVGHTMLQWAIGLAVAIIAATAAGFVIGLNGFLKRFTHSTIEFLRPIPSVALIPLAVLLYGVEIQSALILIIYSAFWQVLIQVIYGVADVDTVADSTARTFGLGPVARLRYVVWPSALPYLMTGVRLAAAVALILAVTAELIIGNPGLGDEIAHAMSVGAITDMYAFALFTGVIGLMVNFVVRRIEFKALAWHSSVRGEAT